jgi:branched-subunit amino acid ABC-type transport system permease component
MVKRRGTKSLNGLKDQGRDVADLVIRYLKQETVSPLKALGRFVVYGTVGSFFLAVGVILLLVAVLRALQEETAVFHGNLSWIPYLIVAILGLLVIALAGLRIAAGPARRRLPPKEGN